MWLSLDRLEFHQKEEKKSKASISPKVKKVIDNYRDLCCESSRYILTVIYEDFMLHPLSLDVSDRMSKYGS